jgi:glycine cleavage system H protein
LAGEVAEANAELEASSELMNSDPYQGGWLIKLKIEGEPTGLLDSQAYKTLIAG